MCPPVEVLREEVRGIQAAILRDLQAARDMAVERKGEVEAENRLGEAPHALHPAGGDRPVRGDPDAHRDPWTGDAQDWSGEGTVVAARAWSV
jgi:hypothetical protein